MRAFSWAPLLGLLVALAAAQDETKPSKSTVIHLFAQPHQSVQSRTSHTSLQSRLETLTDTENVGSVPEAPTHKSDSPSGILETVQALVASVSSPLSAANPAPPEATNQEEVKLDATEEEGNNAAVAGEEVPPTNPTEVDEPSTTLNTGVEEPSPISSSNNKDNSNQVKLVQMYNQVADNVLKVLSRSLSRVEPLPIRIGDDVALTALDESIPEPEPEPEPENENKPKDGNSKTRKDIRKRKKNKNRKNKRKGETSDAEESERNTNKKNRKNKRKGETSDAEETDRNTNKKNRKNRNKGKKNQEEGQEEEEVKTKPARRGNKNKNKRKNRKKNKKMNKSEDIDVSREGKAMSEDEDTEEVQSAAVEEGRRKSPDKDKKNRGNKKNKKNGKTRKNRKNKKNKKNANKKRKDQKVESREDTGPVYPSPEERAASNAYLTGLPSLIRKEDVMVDTTGKAVLVDVKVQVGPLFVQLADAARALTKSHVSTTLEADMQFKIKNKGRGRQIIKLNRMSMTGPQEVTVARLDLPLEPELVSAAKDEVLQALDVARLNRIFERELEAIFEKDNVVQNLEHHELLQV